MFKRSTAETSSFVPTDAAAEMTSTAIEPAPTIPIRNDTESNELELQNSQHVSIISNDLTILGSDLKIISEGAIRVDGEIQGEIRGVDVTVGRRGKVIGTVAGRRVVIDGQVSGEIQAGQVTLRSHSRVDGDVHHQSLTIDLGAMFDGRSKRRETVPEPHQLDETAPQLNRLL